MPPTDHRLQQAKALLRDSARTARRGAILGLDRTAAALAAWDHLAAGIALPVGAVVAGYWPFEDEFDCRPLLQRLAAAGHPLALPVVRGRGLPLDFRRWRPGDPLVPGVFGTSHPADAAAEVRPRVLLVPLLAVDRAGWRLGYGGGFYDRTIAGLRATPPGTLAIGVGFAEQKLAAVPHGPTDEKLDGLATQAGFCRFA